MADIKDLKKNSITKPTVESNDIAIDLTSNNGIEESIKHNEVVHNNTPKGKTIINQPNKIKGPDGRVVTRSNGIKPNQEGRVSFDLTQLPKGDEKEKENIHKSIEDDILTGKNPILYDYIKEKTAEAEQWVANREDEGRLKASLAEDNKSEDDTVSIDLTQSVGSEEAIQDELSFDKYEKKDTIPDENVTYKMEEIDIDLTTNNTGDTMDNNIEEVVETKVEEEKVDDVIEVFDEEDTTEDELELDTEIKAVNDIDKEETVSDVVEEVKIDKDDEINEDVKFSEVDSTPEEDKSVSSEGIEFQAAEAIKQEAINIEAEDDTEPSSNSENPELDESAKHLIELASKVLKPAAKKMDLSSFTVVKKPNANTKFLEQKEITVAKWVLRTKKVCVHMKAAQGAELEELRTLMTDADVASDFIRMYRIIYDHIVSPKPDSFEAWTKSTYVDDLDDYFFCFFIANYNHSNYIPYDCPNKECKYGTFLSDNLPIMSMVKFGSDKDKEEFNNIYKSEIFDTNKEGLYIAERVPFSDRLAIDFKESTLYSFIEAQSIRNNEAFITKYAAAITLAPNIDKIYAIDMANQQLIPVSYKIYPDSNANTYKSKIQKYDAVLKSLSPDEFAALSTYIATITQEKKIGLDIKYVRPAADCPECGAHVDEVETTAQSLVFFRYQLGQMVNISIK